MKRFLMFSVSVLCLSVAVLIGFHVGSQRAEAQAGGEIVGYQSLLGSMTTLNHVLLSNGDLYYRTYSAYNGTFGELKYCGNFFDGAAVSTTPSTWSDVKGLKK